MVLVKADPISYTGPSSGGVTIYGGHSLLLMDFDNKAYCSNYTIETSWKQLLSLPTYD